jgi:hypothetical protein
MNIPGKTSEGWQPGRFSKTFPRNFKKVGRLGSINPLHIHTPSRSSQGSWFIREVIPTLPQILPKSISTIPQPGGPARISSYIMSGPECPYISTQPGRPRVFRFYHPIWDGPCPTPSYLNPAIWVALHHAGSCPRSVLCQLVSAWDQQESDSEPTSDTPGKTSEGWQPVRALCPTSACPIIRSPPWIIPESIPSAPQTYPGRHPKDGNRRLRPESRRECHPDDSRLMIRAGTGPNSRMMSSQTYRLRPEHISEIHLMVTIRMESTQNPSQTYRLRPEHMVRMSSNLDSIPR